MKHHGKRIIKHALKGLKVSLRILGLHASPSSNTPNQSTLVIPCAERSIIIPFLYHPFYKKKSKSDKLYLESLRGYFMLDYHKIYNKLLYDFGEQHWWPSESVWETAVGAILVQNTNWSNVEKSLENLRRTTLFDPKAIYSIPTSLLKQLIRPSGFYNSKSKTIKNLFAFFEYFDFNLIKIETSFDTNALREELLKIKGIGNETADVLLLYIFEGPIIVADLYLRRVVSSLEKQEMTTLSYMVVKNRLENQLQDFSISDFQEFHALVDEFGKKYKKPKEITKYFQTLFENNFSKKLSSRE